MSKENIKFEEKIKRLEQIVNILEEGNVGLEESLKLFQEGMKLGKECKKFLKEIELKINKIIDVNEDGTLETEEFNE
ncbi:exodeoxyribonuclease VII small subunit [Deferribacter thermophilus]|uniref:exodeoxyribonuclease VII small subunit n=1 Tax=Deferribacter thermophilus TaxID=53573 RepID=UPI003C1A3547